MRLPAAALLAALLVLPGVTRADDSWGLSLQLLGGVSRYDVGGLKAGIANQGAAMLKDSASMLGGMALLRLGGLDLGVVYEGGRITSAADSAVLTPTAGFAIPLGELLRLDLLGEVGGHRISNITTSNGGVDYSQARATWLPYLGARPMLTLRLPVGGLKVIGSISGFARWDLVKKDTTLAQTSGGVATLPYRLGGTTFGLTAGAGLEF